MTHSCCGNPVPDLHLLPCERRAFRMRHRLLYRRTQETDADMAERQEEYRQYRFAWRVLNGFSVGKAGRGA